MTLPPHLLDGARKGRGRGGQRREVEIMRAVMTYLASRRVVCWRENVGSALAMNRDGSMRRIRFGVPGLPDILGVLPGGGGRLLACEIKRPGEHPTPQQVLRMRVLADAGALVFVARSIADAAQALDAAGVKPL